MSIQTWEYIANFLTRDEADELLAVLREQQPKEAGDKTRVSHGPQIFPRDKKNSDSQWFTTAQNQKPEPPLLTTLLARLRDKYAVPFNSIQCNYHEGASEVGEHPDPHGTVCMLRVGAPRGDFIVAPLENRSQKTPLVLEHGSLLTFLKSTYHSMKPNPAAGPCVSVIFRLVTEPLTQSDEDNPKRFAEGAKAYDRIVKEFRTKPSQQSLIFVQQSAATLATVEEQSSLTLVDPAEMTSDQLAGTVIDGVKKLRKYLPYIIALKDRFDTGERNSENRLVSPIKDCYSWKEFCETHLDRTPRAISKALAPKPTPIPQPTPIQDWDLPTLLEELTNYKINKIEGDAYAALAEITIKKLKTGRADGVNDTIETLSHAAKIVTGLADTLRRESTEKPTDIFGDK